MKRITPLPIETLIINRSSSTCQNCGKGCDPNEKRHDNVVEYGTKPSEKGCRIEWRFVTSEYMDALSACAAMRPDLELIQWGVYRLPFDLNPV